MPPHYLIDLNASQAALRAGYSKRTAASQGQRLMTHPGVQAAIAAARARLAAKLEITQERVLKAYARIAFFDVRKLFDEAGRPLKVTELDDAAAVVDRVDVSAAGVHRIRLADKATALAALSKHLGLFDAHNRQKGEPVATRASEMSDLEFARRVAWVSRQGEKELDHPTGGTEGVGSTH